MWDVARRSSPLLLAFFLSIVSPACAAPDEAAAAGEDDELNRFQAPVDKTLPDVDAQAYEIDLRVDDVPGRETFKADVKGTYVATKDLDELVLDFVGNRIDEITVGNRPAEHRRDDGRLVIK